MTPRPLGVDLDKLRRVVETAVGCITEGAPHHFQLKAVPRADYRDDDPLMATLTAGATERCYAVELIDAEKGDDLAVKVRGLHFAKEQTHRWARTLWRAWVRGGGPNAGSPASALR